MKIILFLPLVLMFISCQEKNNDVKPEITEPVTLDIEKELGSIEETRQTFMKAVKENDLEALGKVVTADIVTISPGSSEWREMYNVSEKQGPFPYDSIIMYPKETVIVSDSVAYDFGVSHVYYNNSEGKVVELKDSFLAILKKGSDGVWKLHREVASSNVVD